MSEQRHQNNFDAIRLFAALLVLVAHSYPLSGNSGGEPIQRLLGYTSGGNLAVSIFFVISGFCVSQSALHRPLLDFLASRALRILPALTVVVLFAVLVIGPVFTVLPLTEYFRHPMTFEYLENLYIFGVNFYLPGTFKDLPNSGVNGSLWTLPTEISVYIVAASITYLGLRGRWIPLIAVAVFAGALTTKGLWADPRGPILLPAVRMGHFLHFGLYFFIGASFLHLRHKIRLTGEGAFVAALLLLFSGAIYGGVWLQYITVPYLVFFCAFYSRTIDLTRVGDLSYGIYVFAFPIQQSIVQGSRLSGSAIGPTTLSSIAIPLVLLAAFLSWRFVEKPSLQLKPFRRKKACQTNGPKPRCDDLLQGAPN